MVFEEQWAGFMSLIRQKQADCTIDFLDNVITDEMAARTGNQGPYRQLEPRQLEYLQKDGDSPGRRTVTRESTEVPGLCKSFIVFWPVCWQMQIFAGWTWGMNTVALNFLDPQNASADAALITCGVYILTLVVAPMFGALADRLGDFWPVLMIVAGMTIVASAVQLWSLQHLNLAVFSAAAVIGGALSQTMQSLGFSLAGAYGVVRPEQGAAYASVLAMTLAIALFAGAVPYSFFPLTKDELWLSKAGVFGSSVSFLLLLCFPRKWYTFRETAASDGSDSTNPGCGGVCATVCEWLSKPYRPYLVGVLGYTAFSTAVLSCQTEMFYFVVDYIFDADAEVATQYGAMVGVYMTFYSIVSLVPLGLLVDRSGSLVSFFVIGLGSAFFMFGLTFVRTIPFYIGQSLWIGQQSVLSFVVVNKYLLDYILVNPANMARDITGFNGLGTGLSAIALPAATLLIGGGGTAEETLSGERLPYDLGSYRMWSFLLGTLQLVSPCLFLLSKWMASRALDAHRERKKREEDMTRRAAGKVVLASSEGAREGHPAEEKLAAVVAEGLTMSALLQIYGVAPPAESVDARAMVGCLWRLQSERGSWPAYLKAAGVPGWVTPMLTPRKGEEPDVKYEVLSTGVRRRFLDRKTGDVQKVGGQESVETFELGDGTDDVFLTRWARTTTFEGGRLRRVKTIAAKGMRTEELIYLARPDLLVDVSLTNGERHSHEHYVGFYVPVHRDSASLETGTASPTTSYPSESSSGHSRTALVPHGAANGDSESILAKLNDDIEMLLKPVNHDPNRLDKDTWALYKEMVGRRNSAMRKLVVAPLLVPSSSGDTRRAQLSWLSLSEARAALL